MLDGACRDNNEHGVRGENTEIDVASEVLARRNENERVEVMASTWHGWSADEYFLTAVDWAQMQLKNSPCEFLHREAQSV